MNRIWFSAIACVFLAAPVYADSYALVLTGVAGSPEHAERFAKWTESTQKALTDKLNFPADHVLVLADKKATKVEVDKAFEQLRQRVKPADDLFIFFIGHGGADDRGYKFNLTGPDLTASEYNAMLANVLARRTVIVIGTNSSGGAIDDLSGRNRVIITATRSATEGNDALFYGYFVEGLENASSDEDKDQRVSVWEAFRYATQAVDRFYKEEGRLATEHAQISDNGAEKAGPVLKEAPPMARGTYLTVQKAISVSNPRLRALLEDKKKLEQSIEDLRLMKDTLPEAEYEKRMEALLIQLAEKNQQIREEEKKK